MHDAAARSGPVPPDVRAMNALAGVLFAGVAVLLAAAGGAWLARQPLFAIRTIEVSGELSRTSVSTLRANALPQLRGNFFTLDLERARGAFESVPWVRHAVVRRLWPNRLAVRLEEHRAAALWQGEDGDAEKLVNTEGEVFEANLGDVEDERLPAFEGPAGTSADMLTVYRRLAPSLERLPARDATLERLELSGRGSWRAELASGAVIELGRGSEDELFGRSELLVRTLPQIAARFQQRPLEYADLRHVGGYAVRLKGVATTAAPTTTADAGGSTGAAPRHHN